MLNLLLAGIIFAQAPGASAPADQTENQPGVAEDDKPVPLDPARADQGQPQQPPNLIWMLVTMGMPILVLYYLMVARPTQKRERDRKTMLAALKKNDHVVTAGGIKGVVTNVRLDDDEVVLKIDETTGAKMHVVLSSITRVVAAEEDADTAKKES